MGLKLFKQENLSNITRLLTAVSLFSLWIFLLSYIAMEYRLTSAENNDRLSRLALGSAKQTDAVFSTTRLMLSTIATWCENHPDSDPLTDIRLSNLIENFRKQSSYTIDIRFVDGNGGLFYVPSKGNVPLANVSDREYFLVQKNPLTKGFFIAEPIKSRVTHLWGIPVSYPVKNEIRGEFVVFAAIELQSLEKLYAPILSSGSGVISLIRNDGIILSRIPLDDSVIGEKIPGFDQYMEKTGSFTGIINTSNEFTGNIHKSIAFYKLDSLPVYVTVSREYKSFILDWIYHIILPLFTGLLFTSLILYLFKRYSYYSKELDISRQLLEHEARFDSLTGLFNRKQFFKTMNEHIDDNFGHPTGDQVLQQTGRVIRSSIRKNDLAGRVGGEEFAIMLDDASQEIAETVCSRILKGINEIKIPDGITGISIGIATHRSAEERIESWYKRADEALYQAKRAGRNQYVFHREELASL